MTAGGGVNPVDHLGGNVHGGVEAEGHVGAVNIVVNGLGQADDVQPLLAEQVGGFVGAVAAQGEQAVQLQVLIILLHGGDLVHLVVPHHTHQLEGGALGAEDGAAHRQNTGKFVWLHHPRIAVDQAVIAVGDAYDLHIVAHALIQRLGHAAQGGVQAGAVAAGSKDAYTFFHTFLTPLCKRGAGIQTAPPAQFPLQIREYAPNEILSTDLCTQWVKAG